MTPAEGSGSEPIGAPLVASDVCVRSPRTSVRLLSAASGPAWRRSDAPGSGAWAWSRSGRAPLGRARLASVAAYQANSGPGRALPGCD